MSVVDEIKHKLDIVELVSQSVKLRRSGRAYAGFCPFHQNTRTPAFYVFPETQTWHCFGACGMGGDIFTFVMKKENVEFGEALQMLAERAGVQLERDPAAASNVKKLLEINDAAAAYFNYQLKHHAEAAPVRAYVTKRKISPLSLETFQLGYATNSYSALLDHLKAKGFAVGDIVSAGLVSTGEDGRVWDRFRGRLMFPIHNRRGETVGFGARALSDEQQPKYLNSSDSPLFSKSDTLYGLDFAKEAIRREKVAIIVEGYTDVIIAHQEGFKNVVASLGTALTEKQLGQLSRMTKRYVLALDADEAGAAATERGLNLARQALSYKNAPVPVGPGLVVFKERLEAELLILELPEGSDPDEVILQDPAEWNELVQSAKPLLEYYLDVQGRDLDLGTAQGKSEYTRRILPVVAQVKDTVQRTHYAQELARRLRTDERMILDQIQSFEKQDAPVRVNRPQRELPSRPTAAHYDEYLVELGLRAPELLGDVAFVQPEAFERADVREVWEGLLRYNASTVAFDTDAFLATLSDAARETGERLRDASIGIQFEQSQLRRELEAAAYRLQLQSYQNEMTQLRFLLDETPADEQQELTLRVFALSGLIAQTKRALEARTIIKTF